MTMKHVLITGATSGFGKLAVLQLLERGHRVMAGVRGGKTRLEQVFAEELRRFPGRLVAADLHMEQTGAAAEAAALVEREFGGRLDALVNNAGYMLFGPFETQSDADILRQFEVNFFGPMRLTRALLPSLKRSQGRVINISSMGGLVAFPFYGTYNASKFALEAQTEGLYYDLRSQGVHVSLIEPGSFKTEIVTAAKGGELLASSPYAMTVKWLTEWMERHLSLAGNPARVARVIVRRVEQSHPPIRTLVGFDAWLAVILRRLLPEHFRVAVVERVFRRFVLQRRISGQEPARGASLP